MKPSTQVIAMVKRSTRPESRSSSILSIDGAFVSEVMRLGPGVARGAYLRSYSDYSEGIRTLLV